MSIGGMSGSGWRLPAGAGAALALTALLVMSAAIFGPDLVVWLWNKGRVAKVSMITTTGVTGLVTWFAGRSAKTPSGPAGEPGRRAAPGRTRDGSAPDPHRDCAANAVPGRRCQDGMPSDVDDGADRVLATAKAIGLDAVVRRGRMRWPLA